METSPTKITSFTDLIAWKEAHKLVLMIYEVTKNFPRDEVFGLISQMRRCSVSISSNIAEGFTRRGKNEKIQFYKISQGSLTELQNQLIISKDIQYIDSDIFKNITNQTITVNKIIYGLINGLNTKY